jgi:hypothetical protein
MGARTILNAFIIIIVIVVAVGCTALGGPWPPQANIASAFYPEHPPANFYNQVFLCPPPPRQSILILVHYVHGEFQGLSTACF